MILFPHYGKSFAFRLLCCWCGGDVKWVNFLWMPWMDSGEKLRPNRVKTEKEEDATWAGERRRRGTLQISKERNDQVKFGSGKGRWAQERARKRKKRLKCSKLLQLPLSPSFSLSKGQEKWSQRSVIRERCFHLQPSSTESPTEIVWKKLNDRQKKYFKEVFRRILEPDKYSTLQLLLFPEFTLSLHFTSFELKGIGFKLVNLT